METINQATSAIRGAVWGDNNNNTPTTANTTTTNSKKTYGSGSHSEVHKSMIDDTVTETRHSGRLESDPDAEGAYQPNQDHDTDRRPQGPISTGGVPQGANVTGDQGDTNKNPFSSSNEPNTGFGGSAGAQPSVNADPLSARQDISSHQGGDKPTAEPETRSTGSGSSGISGAGSTGSGAGGPGGMKLPDSDNQSKGEGTGTKYERSTGFAAEGGDFDATRPGAAREGARLMDEHGLAHTHGDKPGESGEPKKEKKWYGVDHSGFGGHGSHQNKRLSFSKASSGDPEDETNTTTTTTDTTAAVDHTEKKGLAQKIKEKLHHSSDETK